MEQPFYRLVPNFYKLAADFCSTESPDGTGRNFSQQQGSFRQLLRVPSSLSCALFVGEHTDGSWKPMQFSNNLGKKRREGLFLVGISLLVWSVVLSQKW